MIVIKKCTIYCITSLISLTIISSYFHLFHTTKKAKFPESFKVYLDFVPKKFETLSLDPDISELIRSENISRKILNEDLYGPVTADTTVFVISVRKFNTDLKAVIASLSAASGIQDTLIIFSHLYYDKNANDIIKMIDFCRVLQLFYPHSLQVTKHSDTVKRDLHHCAFLMDIGNGFHCIRYLFPRTRQRYIFITKAQEKHWWWWTANTVFENLPSIENYTGLFVFMSSEYYLLEDIVYMTIFMGNIIKTLERCEFVVLGCGEIRKTFTNGLKIAEHRLWDPDHHSTVLAFNRTIWNTIVAHYNYFCGSYDYSWPHALFYISSNRKDGVEYFKAIISNMPKVIKNHKGTSENIVKIIEYQKKYQHSLFPKYLEIHEPLNQQKINLELSSIEDMKWYIGSQNKDFCYNLTINKARKIVMDLKYNSNLNW